MMANVHRSPGWHCTPCGEWHEFGDICWYWDVDPLDASYDAEPENERDRMEAIHVVGEPYDDDPLDWRD